MLYKFRYGWFFILLLVLWSCKLDSKKESAEMIYEVAVLRGPSAIAFAQWMEKEPVLKGKKMQVKVLDSPEQMQALLVKGEADIAVLPMISAANLYNKGIRYPLLGCPIWGTLYLVGHDRIVPPVYLFGAGTTPDILARYYLEQKGAYAYDYSFATAREVLLSLQTDKVQTAVLSEPFLSMALEQDSTLRILADLNRPDSLSYGFPQTAVVCRESLLTFKDSIQTLLDQSCRFAQEKPEEAIRILENRRVFGNRMLSPATIERCRIRYIPATDCREEVGHFLELMNHYEPRSTGGRLPDSTFIP